MPRSNVPPPLQIDQIKLAGERKEQSSQGFRGFFSKHTLNLEDLQALGELGKGNSGFVTKVRHIQTNEILARKVIMVDVCLSERSRIMQELNVLEDCDSPYIVSYFGACHKNNEIHLFMEYMNGRSLDFVLRKVGKIQEDILGKITVSVIKGLTYLRDKLNIMHRDIKPSNILVNDSGAIKLCDFGVSGRLIDSIAQTFVGTKYYMSPERITGHPYTVQSDIWSLGLTLVELALGVYPVPQRDPIEMYEGERPPEVSVFELFNCIVNDSPPTIPGPPYFSEEFKDFIDGCLKKDARHRFDLRSIVQQKFVIDAENAVVHVDRWVCQVCSIPTDTKNQSDV